MRGREREKLGGEDKEAAAAVVVTWRASGVSPLRGANEVGGAPELSLSPCSVGYIGRKTGAKAARQARLLETPKYDFNLINS